MRNESRSHSLTGAEALSANSHQIRELFDEAGHSDILTISPKTWTSDDDEHV
jgi:hypothetical protein